MTMGHDHAHEHAHGPTGPATVMADVGGDVGAAVVYTPEALVGCELEIRAVGRAWDGTHTGVRERQAGATTSWAGFFGRLPAGRYEVRVRDGASRSIAFDVVGATVTETSW
jgi:hypothetical protein